MRLRPSSRGIAQDLVDKIAKKGLHKNLLQKHKKILSVLYASLVKGILNSEVWEGGGSARLVWCRTNRFVFFAGLGIFTDRLLAPQHATIQCSKSVWILVLWSPILVEPYYLYYAAFLLAALFVFCCKPIAVYFRIVDQPDYRKLHSRDIPLVGGVAIFCGFVISVVLANVAIESLKYFLTATLFLGIVGVCDDGLGLSPRMRLMLQAATVLYLTLAGDVIVRDLGDLLPAPGLFDLHILTYPFTLFAVIGIINAFNLSDGLDGLAGGLTLVPLLAIALITYSAGQHSYMTVALLLSSALGGFLLFNLRTPWRHEASVFLGSAGSTFLGLALSWLLIELSQGQARVIEPAAVPWFLAVPFLDMVFVMSRRVLKGRSPFQADREHFHHVLLLAGYSVKQCVAILLSLSALCIIIGQCASVFLPNDMLVLVLVLFAASACAYFAMMTSIWKRMRFAGRSICRRRATADRRAADRRCVVSTAMRSQLALERRLGVDRRQCRDRRRTIADSHPVSTDIRHIKTQER